MKERKGWSKGLVVIAFWVLGLVVLILALGQVRDYAGIINDSGVVRGGTQRVVKMELAGGSSDDTKQRVSELLDTLQANEQRRLYHGPETMKFMDNLAAVQKQWQLIQNEMEALRQGSGSTSRLVSLSETHFTLADEMVLSAQVRAEHEFVWTGFICTALFLGAATIMIFMRNDRIAKLRKAYYTDPLTQGANLLSFEDEAGRLIANAADGAYLVAYTNVSNFRFINEAYGYEAGDELIRALGTLFAGACKRGELAAHANADHFVLLLRNEPGRAMDVHERIEAKLRATPELHFTGVLALGFGVRAVEHASESMPLLVSNAIAVLKNAPEDTAVSYYDQAFRDAMDLENRIEQHEDQALANREFLLYLQPKNNLEDDSLAGAEALVRWESADLGFLPPDAFIPVFEKSGFIVQLDFYMLKRVCESRLRAADGAPLVVSVNFSRVTILREGFVERLLRVVDGAGIPHDAVEVEITESAFIMDEDAVIDKLKALKALGFRLAMDDFGTGYSSLNLLRKLPLDVLKIDRSFLSENPESESSRAVLKGVIDMADDLGLVTVCEGVETREQAAMLRELGCPVAQGYAYSKPLPEAEFRARYEMRR